MMIGMSRAFKNIRGKAKGISGCARCGDNWDWKKEHQIPYQHDAKGRVQGLMFPVCEECYQKISPEERMEYCVQLWKSWGSPKGKVDWDIVKQEVGIGIGC